MTSTYLARLERIIRQWKEAQQARERADRREARMARVFARLGKPALDLAQPSPPALSRAYGWEALDLDIGESQPALPSPLDDHYRQPGE